MDEGVEKIDIAARDLDDRMEEDQRLTLENHRNFADRYEELKAEGRITPEIETLVRLARRAASSDERICWMEAALETSTPEHFNALVSKRDQISQDYRDHEAKQRDNT